jgi:small GTP-binding protein
MNGARESLRRFGDEIATMSASGSPTLRTVKIVVGGEGSVGKTSLIRRYAKAKFSEARNITLGIDITTQEYRLGEQPLKLALWDIEGQAGNRPNFYLGAQAALLVFDLTAPHSLEALQMWVERMKRYAPDTPCIVAGNKSDLPQAVPTEWGTAFAAYAGADRFVQLSAKADTNVTPTFVRLAELAFLHAQAGAGGDDLV